MTRKEILEKAEEILAGKREEYPENSFDVIAKMWSDYVSAKCTVDFMDEDGKYYCGASIKPEDVAVMMALLKIGRIMGGHYKEDSYIDACGYMAWAGELGGTDA